MFRIPGFDHRTGHDCGSAALRNLTEFYGWDLDESTCFGLGGGIASVDIDQDDREWNEFLGRPRWLETQFFDSIGLAHDVRADEEFEAAWDDVTGRIENEDPVMLFLDPGELGHVPESEHVPSHVALAIGYSDDAVLLSDASEPEAVRVPKAELRDAWRAGALEDRDNRYLVVTEAGFDVDVEEAANRAFRETTTYMLDTRTYERTMGATGEHGPTAIQSFAEDVESWTNIDDTVRAARRAHYAITEHGQGAAYRYLYADALERLAPETGVGGALADRMHKIGEEWEAAGEEFARAAGADDERERRVALSEAAGTLNDIARREQRFFKHARDEF